MRELCMVVATVLIAGSASAQNIEDSTKVTAGRSTVVTGWVERAIDHQPARPLQPAQSPKRTQKRGWIARHPALFGALVGFGSGFLIGYLPGDDGVFSDFDAEFNGVVLGGVGALTGAVIGAAVD